MDKRGELRVAHQIRFFVHVHECKEDPDLVGVSVECEAIDISSRGMQFKTDSKLFPRSIVNITIGVGDPFAMYELQGEIRWVKSLDDDFCMGILLQENDGDYEKWESAFKSTFG